MTINSEISLRIVDLLDKIAEADFDEKRMLLEELNRLYRLEALESRRI